MQNRKIKARRQKIIRISSLVLSSVVILLLLASLITDQSPTNVIRNLWGDMSGFTNDPMKMNKSTLRKYVIAQENVLDSLRLELQECGANKGKKGIVSVNAPTLNMRSMPSLSSDIILKIPNGTEVLINYFDTKNYYLDGIQGQWCNITHVDKMGWVWGPYVKLIK